jgi:uncharacterized protein (DUF2147 family)
MRFRTGLENPMKKLVIAAALLLTASAAQAGASYSFEIGGRTVRLHAPRGCDSPSCISISIPGVYDSGRKGFDDDDSDVPDAPQAAALPAALATPPAIATPSAPAIVTPAPAQQAAAPTAASTPAGDAAPPAQPGVATPPARTQAATTVATATPVAEPVQPPSPVAEPVGMWVTEKKEGHVRIEECGSYLCGYSVDSRTRQNKEKVLINMKPSGSKWSGKIYDPKSGSTYSSTIAMKGKDGLRVQGCAFGGMFCGGQTWTRTN